MKTRKDTYLKLIAIPFIMIAFTISIILLSDNSVKAASDTSVVLKQDGQNVKVSLSPKEGASIASFQIGLKIEATKASDIKKVTFNWANIGSAKLTEESYDKKKGILNLYVVTEAEQNTGKTIDVGTIKVETNKSTKVTVTPIANKTTASSIAHKDTAVGTSSGITYTASANSGNQGGSTNKPGGNTGGSGNQGSSSSGNQGGNTSGSGNNSGSGSTGNGGNSGSAGSGSGNSSNGSNSGSSTDDNNDDDKDDDKEDDEEEDENNDENNIEDTNEIDDGSSSNQLENIATGALPQTGEKDNFMVVWIIMVLVVLVGVLLAFGYKRMNKKNSFKL